jgi:hypothetical protein
MKNLSGQQVSGLVRVDMEESLKTVICTATTWTYELKISHTSHNVAIQFVLIDLT